MPAMRLRKIRTALVISGTLFAGGCGGGMSYTHVNTQEYESTPAAATSLFSSLHQPPTFIRARSCRQMGIPNVYTACFVRRRSLALTSRLFRDLATSSGVRIISATLRCSHPQRFHKPRLQLQNCTASARLGTNHLSLSVNSLVLAGPAGVTGTARVQKGIPQGTTYSITDLGTPRTS